MKLALRVSYAANIVALVILLTEFGLKFKLDPHEILVPSFYAACVNLSVGSVLLVGLLAVGGTWMARLMESKRLGKAWTQRRHRSTLVVEAELVVQLINLIAFLIPNAVPVAHVLCEDPLFHRVLAACVIIRWTCWNTLFLFICVHAHNINPWRRAVATWLPGKQWAVDSNRMRPTALVVDGPWFLHWPKLLIW
ncbi:hypothetical protein WJX84_004115 [Apatococcus fuscideae]|uniref:Uncharacterized protein n=1 Tax=Apatococcus fuscideae TaxID=2026836 RepID=A0AAW1SZN6_9CHLO